MSTNFQLLKEMKKRVPVSIACMDSLIGVPPDSERFEMSLGLFTELGNESHCIIFVIYLSFWCFKHR